MQVYNICIKPTYLATTTYKYVPWNPLPKRYDPLFSEHNRVTPKNNFVAIIVFLPQLKWNDKHADL